MPKRIKMPPVVSDSYWDSEIRLLVWLATCVSVFSFLYYYRFGDVMLYGDAVAHINIARRVFDSKTPGLLQLGTVWLPLPHLLMIPFLISKEMWQRGVGGSIPSMAAYVFGVVGIFRLVRGSLSRKESREQDLTAHVAAWIAALIYAANPNLIYMQSTAMGEALYLALFIWAVVYFSEFWRGDRKALNKCGLCLSAACLTRYDGWFLAVVMAGVVVVVALLPQTQSRLSRGAAIRFVLIAAAAPALWLAYNGIVYRNPLEFENGPYSAKAIERKTQNAGNPGHPGTGDPLVAGLYFVKAAEENVATNPWLQRGWLLLALMGMGLGGYVGLSGADGKIPTLAAQNAARTRHPIADQTRRPARMGHPVLFFWFLIVPLPFYALSVAYSGVPIFVPAWWPFTMYNVRYGLQLLPAFAVGLALAAWLALRYESWHWRIRLLSILAVFVFVAASFAWVWRAEPVCLREAEVNMRSHNQLDTQLAGWLEKLPPNATILMYLGDHVGALEQAGIPLRDTINEGNHRVWKQPYDPDGLWERTLADPARNADYVVAFENDPVWKAVQSGHLEALVEIHVSGQPRTILYRAR